nr:hypothetical protein [Tanacetum cinerariifolium]
MEQKNIQWRIVLSMNQHRAFIQLTTGRMIDELDKDEGAVLMSEKEEKKTEEVKDITGDAQVEGSETVNVAAVVPAAVTETVSTTAVVPIVTAALVKVAVPSTS